MIRKFTRWFALVAGLALLAGLAPSATADHSTDWPASAAHEPIPVDAPEIDELLGRCDVNGFVNTFGDKNAQGTGKEPDKARSDSGFIPAHSHYRFQETDLVCVATPLSPAPHLAGLYNVLAWGGADGPCQVDPDGNTSNADGDPAWEPDCPDGLKHGSTLAISWSHSGGDPTLGPGTNKDNPGGGFAFAAACGIGGSAIENKNSITAAGPLGPSEGWVKFDRVGPDAVAWGQFCNGPLEDVKFIAELLFLPVPSTTSPGEFEDNLFSLTGEAVIFCGSFDKGKPKSGAGVC